MQVLYPEHTTERKKPINLKQEDLLLFEHEFVKKIRETNILTLTNAIILKDIVVDIKQRKSFQNYTHMDSLGVMPILKRVALFFLPSRKIERGLWFIDDWSGGYFHWLTDALPRLIASEEVDKRIPVILPADYEQMPFIVASLDILQKEVLYFNPIGKLKVKELMLCSHTANTGNYNRLLINKLRERFLGPEKKSAHRKIYMSREKALRRKVENEAEVQAVMASFGIEIHYFEEYPFKEQVKIMNESKVLIGLHGAGLTNMLFMPAGGSVLELRNREDDHNNCFYSLASELDHRYYYMLNQGDREDTHTVEVKVDIEELRATLERMNSL
jgi:capsular polysaccharide biosynthesis protein